MPEISKTWPMFKDAVESRSLDIRYAYNDSIYVLYAKDDVFLLACKIDRDEGVDVTEFETDFKPYATEI